MTMNCGMSSARFVTKLRPCRASADDGQIGANSLSNSYGRSSTLSPNEGGASCGLRGPRGDAGQISIWPLCGWIRRMGSGSFARHRFGSFALRAMVFLYGPILTHGVRQDRVPDVLAHAGSEHTFGSNLAGTANAALMTTTSAPNWSIREATTLMTANSARWYSSTVPS